MVHDVLDPTRHNVARLEVATDGVWVSYPGGAAQELERVVAAGGLVDVPEAVEPAGRQLPAVHRGPDGGQQ